MNWHIKNLIDNNINIKRKNIENILYKDRAAQYPSDDEILTFIDSIKMPLNENNQELLNLPFVMDIINL